LGDHRDRCGGRRGPRVDPAVSWASTTTSASCPVPTSEKALLMLANKSRRMASITTTLPVLVLDKIDELVESDKVPSRSFLIREAVRRYLKEFERK